MAHGIVHDEFIAAKLLHVHPGFELCTFCAQQAGSLLQPWIKEYFYFVNLR